MQGAARAVTIFDRKCSYITSLGHSLGWKQLIPNIIGGWDRMFSLAKIYTTGIASSLLAGKHVKRTRYAYNFTLAWLHIFKLQAYDAYCWEVYGPYASMDIWEKRLGRYASTICYWTTVRDYLLVNCRCIRGQRVGDWPLTMSACNYMCP